LISWDVFDQKVPFVKEIADSCMNAANDRGYIKTLLGRRRHFILWEPMDAYKRNRDFYQKVPGAEKCVPMRLEEAQAKYPGVSLRRSNTHKALNALIQGSSADMTKAALIKIRREGNVIPYMQVHDEIDFAARDKAHALQCQHLAETCVDMTVPIRADLSLGKTWR